MVSGRTARDPEAETLPSASGTAEDDLQGRRWAASVGYPTVQGRVVQTAAKLVLELIFGVDFVPISYLKGYFDTIPHDKLMVCVE